MVILQCAAANAQGTGEIGADRLKGKFALVIGNGAYEGNALPNPPNDATDIAVSLRAIGFDVTLAINLDLKAMRVAIAKFAGRLPDNSAALVFYAGHGVQFAGRNYLLPIGSLTKINKPADLRAHAISLVNLMDQITVRKNAISIFILDACRDSPFKALPEISSGLARGLTRLKPSKAPNLKAGGGNLEGVLIAYSTAPDAVASDGVGRNSPYTKHLKDALRRPNTALDAMLKLTRSGVTVETSGAQTPWYESSLNGDFYPAGRGRIEFGELLKLFVPVPDGERKIPNAYYLYSWDLGATEFSPIQWSDNGVQFADDKTMVRDFNQREWGLVLREGTVVITIDGTPTHHVLLRQKTPGQWRIAMGGVISGFAAVSFANNALTFEFGGFRGSSHLKEDATCRTGDTSSGTTVYSVGIPGRIPAWLAEEWSCGTGGCTHNYILFYNRRDRTRFACGS